jgi:hypothetical protein
LPRGQGRRSRARGPVGERGADEREPGEDQRQAGEVERVQVEVDSAADDGAAGQPGEKRTSDEEQECPRVEQEPAGGEEEHEAKVAQAIAQAGNARLIKLQ